MKEVYENKKKDQEKVAKVDVSAGREREEFPIYIFNTPKVKKVKSPKSP